MLKTNMQRTWKAKRIKMFLIMLQACFRICGSYMMYLEGDGSHQTIMILCECIWSSYIITFHIMIYLNSLAKGSHTTCIFFATFDTIVQVQCDLAITRDTCGSIHFLNFLNMFWNKIWLDFFSVFFISECFASRVEVMFLCLICSLIAYFRVYLVCFHLVLLLLLENHFSSISIAAQHLLNSCLIPPDTCFFYWDF